MIDMWSLGCVLGELVLGVPVFSGSNDFHQISKISDLLGTPNDTNWPNMSEMPDFGKLQFMPCEGTPFDQYFGIKDANELAVIGGCIKFGDRPPPDHLLANPYFLNKEDLMRGRKLLGMALKVKQEDKNKDDIFKI